MIEFFKASDFVSNGWLDEAQFFKAGRELAAKLANAKLEQLGHIVYSPDLAGAWTPFGHTNQNRFKGLIIGVEPIEKCKHSHKDVIRFGQVKGTLQEPFIFECRCGVKVKPTAFEEIDTGYPPE